VIFGECGASTLLNVTSGKVIGFELSLGEKCGAVKKLLPCSLPSRVASESLASELPELAALPAVLKTPSHSTH